MYAKESYSLFLQIIFVFAFGFTLASGCEDRVINPIEEHSGVFSFYGSLQVGEAPHYVRVKDLNEEFLAGQTEFNGTVTFEDTETGEVITLQDSIVNFGDNFTHNFIIEKEIEYNKEYLLRAVRTDGEMVQSVASTPGLTEVRLNPDPFLGSPIFCETPVHFRFLNVVEPELIQMKVTVFYNNDSRSATLFYFLREFQRVEGRDIMEITMSPNNLLVEIFPENVPDIPPTSSFYDPYEFEPGVDCHELDSDQMQITYTHFGKEWAVARPFSTLGTIDTESGDIENGLGFFGGFHRDFFTFTISDTPEPVEE